MPQSGVVMMCLVLTQCQESVGRSALRGKPDEPPKCPLRFTKTVLVVKESSELPPALVPGWPQAQSRLIEAHGINNPIITASGIGILRNLLEGFGLSRIGLSQRGYGS